MTDTFDQRHIRRAFSRSAASYDAAAALQHEVEQRLLESLDYFALRKVDGERKDPQVVLDVGSGPARAAAAMRKRWPRAQVIALDLALPMLREAKKNSGWWNPFARVCADARALPVADHSVDVLFTNLCLQWVQDLPAVFAGFRRVLKPGGLLLFAESTRAYIESWLIRLLFRHPMEAQHSAGEYMAMVREAGFQFGSENVSTPYLWWSRSDLGAVEFWGFGVPKQGEREETLINLVATRA